MARVPGTFIKDTNYEVNIRKPLDARTVVREYADLLLLSNWQSTTGKGITYNGLIVAVVNTTDTTRNGLYMLFDPACTSALKTPDVTKAEHWIKIGETADISNFAERLANLETDLADFEARLIELESKNVETYGYFSGLPSVGVAGKLYVVVDRAKTYVWVNGSYLCVGDDTESYDEINGGDATSEN